MKVVKLIGLWAALSMLISGCSSSGSNHHRNPDDGYTSSPETNSTTDDHPNHMTDLGKIKLKLIPAGSFMMGASASDTYATTYESPSHKVNITSPFYIGVYEITQHQWEAVMGAGTNPSNNGDQEPTEDMSDHPVERVNYRDIKNFLDALNNAESITLNGEKYEYDLPTEAEWEYVARAGSTSVWSFGDNEQELGAYAWYDGNSNDNGIGLHHHKVGQKKPNIYGIYDLYGNVAEALTDYGTHATYCPYPSSEISNPVCNAGLFDTSVNLITRGGNFANDFKKTRSSAREYEVGAVFADITGFRIVLVPKNVRDNNMTVYP